MKNVQVVDGAENCMYEIYSIDDESFFKIFPDGQDIEFVDDFIARLGEEISNPILEKLWEGRQEKKKVKGIHGTLFYELDYKKKYYPTKKENEMKLVL